MAHSPFEARPMLASAWGGLDAKHRMEPGRSPAKSHQAAYLRCSNGTYAPGKVIPNFLYNADTSRKSLSLSS